MRKKNPLRGLVKFCILLVLVLVMLYSGLRILESTVLLPEQDSQQIAHRKTIIRNGREYYPRQDITVLLVMGIDEHGPAQTSNYYRNEGAADTVLLMILDETNQESRVLCLNRDTMMNMDTIGVTGEYAGTIYGQLAMAHTYGDGMEASCENVRSTLMHNLHGLNVDYYVSMRLDAMPVINDSVGGVTVNVVDNFGSLPMGEVTLKGDQVLTYVQTRRNVGDQLNLSRMERQKEYIGAFMDVMRVKAEEDSGLVLQIYEEVSPYLVTDCTANTLTMLVDKYLEYPLTEILIPEGENVIEGGHYAFYPDEEKLDDLILDLFYVAK